MEVGSGPDVLRAGRLYNLNLHTFSLKSSQPSIKEHWPSLVFGVRNCELKETAPEAGWEESSLLLNLVY